jgi:hypothetical protein
MKFPARQRVDDWRDRLPPYGQPVPPPDEVRVAPPVVDPQPPRRRTGLGAGLLGLALGAGVVALVLHNQDDPRSLGTQLDDTIRQVRGVGSEVRQTVADSHDAAAQASRQAIDGVSTALDDSAISLKVKTALAADPALSAARIEVTTTAGVVRLDGPAPDAAAKDRATVLASAPRGVRAVDNRLALPQPGKVVAVVEPAVPAPQR